MRKSAACLTFAPHSIALASHHIYIVDVANSRDVTMITSGGLGEVEGVDQR